VPSADALAQQLATEFIRLKALVDQTPNLNGVIRIPALTEDAKFSFTDQQESAVAGVLYKLGVVLYDRLFYSAPGNVPQILQRVEKIGSTSKQPLRIAFFTNQIYIPWQILHPLSINSNINVGDFWGFKYVITSIPQDGNRACGPLPSQIPWPDPLNLIYVSFHTTAATPDIMTTYGQLFGQSLRASYGLGSLAGPLGSEPFIETIKTRNASLSSLFFFTHAHSGTLFSGSPSQSVISTDPNGSRIDFSETDALPYFDLLEATIVADKTVPFFQNHPFVLLNGCETGTQGVARTTANSLPGIFLDRGASVVIATEAPIWDQFGLGFANKLVSLLAAGESVGDALLLSRKYFLDYAKNPLGLVYSLYGNSSASFTRQISQRSGRIMLGSR
jgi:hypothetical protein